MILRFARGRSRRRGARGTVASHRRIRAAAAACRVKRSRTCVASSSRSSPLSTKMQVSRSPMARWISSAATVESTPPLRPQTTRPSPTCVPDARGRLVDERRHRPVARAAADAVGEVPEDLEAALGVRDLGVKQQRVQRRAGVLHRRDRRVGARRDDGEARRRGGDEVAVARPHAELAGHCANRSVWPRARRPHVHDARGRTRDAAPAPRGRRACRSSAACRSRCRAPACRGRRRRVAARRARLRHAARAAREDDADGLARAQRLARRVERQNLAVDGQLAQAARDELRVLRAEIENENGLMGHAVDSDAARRGRRAVSRPDVISGERRRLTRGRPSRMFSRR